ncbi:MAG: hypothetical protein SVU32_04045, partial [Candidatus Nanohaloarchaea archaeon]|nr:hypothetical protein [Candidatus Nanohaloarchaea archaeon]
MKRTLVVALFLTLLLAGCTGGGGGTGDTNTTDMGFTQQGVLIKSVSVSKERFRAGDSGFLTVTVQNMNLVPAREL